MSYIVYKMRNKLTGEIVYVGSTSQKLNARMREHRCKSDKSAAYEYIIANGKENIILEEICTCTTKQEALEKEIYWTNELGKKWNLLNKYTGNRHSEEQKVYMSKLHSGKGNPCYGKSVHTKKIRCITTNKFFDSIKEASDFYGIVHSGGSHIGEVCRGRRKYCGSLEDGTKLQWEFI